MLVTMEMIVLTKMIRLQFGALVTFWTFIVVYAFKTKSIVIRIILTIYFIILIIIVMGVKIHIGMNTDFNNLLFKIQKTTI